MDFALVTDFTSLATEWNTLRDESVTITPFLRYEYLTAWWTTLGAPGEWPHGELHLLTGRRRGRLVALAPLFASVNHDGEPVLALLGTDAMTDSLDILARPDDHAPFLHLLFDHLNAAATRPWTALELYNLPEGSPTLTLIPQLAAQRGWHCHAEPLTPCSAVDLPRDWETYLASLDKKQRHELRRKMRKCQDAGTTAWRIARDPDTIDADIETFFKLMAFHEEKRWIEEPSMRTLMRTILRRAFDHGWLHLALLTLDGETAAAFLAYEDANAIHVHNSGLNPAYRDLSPGIVLLGLLIRDAIERGRRRFDFLRGDEPYKRALGAQLKASWHLTVTRG